MLMFFWRPWFARDRPQAPRQNCCVSFLYFSFSSSQPSWLLWADPVDCCFPLASHSLSILDYSLNDCKEAVWYSYHTCPSPHHVSRGSSSKHQRLTSPNVASPLRLFPSLVGKIDGLHVDGGGNGRHQKWVVWFLWPSSNDLEAIGHGFDGRSLIGDGDGWCVVCCALCVVRGRVILCDGYCKITDIDVPLVLWWAWLSMLDLRGWIHEHYLSSIGYQNCAFSR
jgi:hypothetical protein